jgi:hypothetical protein
MVIEQAGADNTLVERRLHWSTRSARQELAENPQKRGGVSTHTMIAAAKDFDPRQLGVLSELIPLLDLSDMIKVVFVLGRQFEKQHPGAPEIETCF